MLPTCPASEDVTLMTKAPVFAAVLAVFCITAASQALTVPFTENFAGNNANWQNNANGLATYNAIGGPDGGAYISGPFNFQSSKADDTPVVLRGNPSTPLGPASGGNFIGNWLAGGVIKFSAYVRHNAPEPLIFLSRFADPIGFPGFIVSDTLPVEPNTWTLIELPIDPNYAHNHNESMPFQSVFDSIGYVQLGVWVPEGLAGLDQTFTFDATQVSIAAIPEPATSLMAGLALAIGCFTRRMW